MEDCEEYEQDFRTRGQVRKIKAAYEKSKKNQSMMKRTKKNKKKASLAKAKSQGSIIKKKQKAYRKKKAGMKKGVSNSGIKKKKKASSGNTGIVVGRTNGLKGRPQRVFRPISVDGRPVRADLEGLFTITQSKKGNWPSPSGAAAKFINKLAREGFLKQDDNGSFPRVVVVLQEITKGAPGKMYSYVGQRIKSVGSIGKGQNKIEFKYTVKIAAGSKVSHL